MRWRPRFLMTGATPVWDPHFTETLEGSLSAVLTPQIAKVGAPISRYQNFQRLHYKQFGNSPIR